ncbi:MAG: hypothetical protein ACPG5B_00705 [Chitinophagales bacterium]
MKQFKGFQFLATILALCAALVMFDSCTPEDDECILECQNGGNCVLDNLGNAVCECAEGSGFFGPNCEQLDSCFNVICPANAECDGGDCYCFAGYEGDSCQLEIREKYYGSYAIEDICQSGNYTYSVTILESANDITKFLIQGFGGFDDPVLNVVCTVLDSEEFEIEAAAYPGLPTLQSLAINGEESTYDAETGVITLTYLANFDDGTSDECDMVLTPQ